jgi:hypothetical protein
MLSSSVASDFASRVRVELKAYRAIRCSVCACGESEFRVCQHSRDTSARPPLLSANLINSPSVAVKPDPLVLSILLMQQPALSLSSPGNA